MINGLMIDVDGVLVCGRPSDGKPWASFIESDLGFSVEDLQREFFTPHWNDIVIGQCNLIDQLKPALAKIAPHVCYDDFTAYWFEHDARLNVGLLAEIEEQRGIGKKVYLATNQEHARAAYLMDELGLGNHCDGIFYSAAMGCRKPEKEFFAKAATLSGLSPSQLPLIDDTLANVSAARVSGWNAAQWFEGSSLADALSKFDAA